MMQKRHNTTHIEAKGISKAFPGSKPVIANFSGKIQKNSLTAIKGPSGCGKTTLLRLIAGLDKPSRGTLILDGKTASTGSKIHIPPDKRNIGFLFQDLALWPHMTGSRQLQFVWDSRKVRREKHSYLKRRKTLLKEVGFPEKLLSRYPHELSRGQQQRLAIARSAITLPCLLLLDEPFTGLDQELRGLFVTFLKKLRKGKKTTILLVTHDLIQDLIVPDATLSYKNGTFTKH